MSSQDKSESRLKERFYNELLPTWDFERLYIDYGKKLLEKIEE